MAFYLSDDELDEVAELLFERLVPLLQTAPPLSPWMRFEEAVAYSRIPAGTFRRLSAMGLLPSYGGRTKLYRRDEIDEAIVSGRTRLAGPDAETSSQPGVD